MGAGPGPDQRRAPPARLIDTTPGLARSPSPRWMTPGHEARRFAAPLALNRRARLAAVSATRSDHQRREDAVSVGDEVLDYVTLRQDVARAVARLCPRWMVDRRDDLVQAAVMRVMRIAAKRSASGEGNQPLSTSYLYKVAYSVLVDEIRRLRRRRETDLEDEAVAPVAIATRESGAHGGVEGDRSRHPRVPHGDEAGTATRRDAAPPGTHRARSRAHPRLGGQADGEPRLSRPGGPSRMPDGEGDTTVTDVRGSDERLADAFRALGDSHDTELPEDLRERIWLAVSGVLPPEERRELVERTATDPGCAEAWRIASELWRASQAPRSVRPP